MYNFNEEKCKKLTNGEIAVHYNNGDLEMLRALLKKCAPDDDQMTDGQFEYYWVDRVDYWNGDIETTKPYISLSDFIVNESKEEFEWTDELAQEYLNYSLREHGLDGSKLEQFKASKQRKCLFTTEDGKEIFEGDEYWYVWVESEYEIKKHVAVKSTIKEDGIKDFSTEAAAKEYVRLNKPSYSLNDIYNAWRKCDGGYLDLINTLEKIKQ